MGLTFLSCKNVATGVERESPGRLNARRAKDGKPPLVKMYTLLVDGVKRLFQAHAGSDDLSSRALHICRGHFKDFSHGGGLFGKYTGRYWWTSQTRGSKEAGEVIKDYAVKAR